MRRVQICGTILKQLYYKILIINYITLKNLNNSVVLQFNCMIELLRFYLSFKLKDWKVNISYTRGSVFYKKQALNEYCEVCSVYTLSVKV